MMLVPYSKVINLGHLRSGNYAIFFADSLEPLAKAQLTISIATVPQQDDYLYAPVNRVTYKPAHGLKPASLILHGNYTNSCMKLKRVKVKRENQSDTIVVLPVTEIKSLNCRDILIPFNEVFLLGGLGSGRVLLHVRSLNGQSLNTIVDL